MSPGVPNQRGSRRLADGTGRSVRAARCQGRARHAQFSGLLLLVHGWPQTWYAWRLVMPALARDFTVVAPDQRGTGLSGKPAGGYDTGTLAGDMDALGHQRFAAAGHDTGMWIGYALAADHPGRLDRLAVAEAAMPARLRRRLCRAAHRPATSCGISPSTGSPG
jgi:pimeloyl-ACP methyl ester carboxylesterase